MKCLADRNKIHDLAVKRMDNVIKETSKFTTAMTVYILFHSFGWGEERVREFLRRYDKYSDMIVQAKYNTLPYDDRPKEGWTFEEYAEMCNETFKEEKVERHKLKNSCVSSKNLVLQRTEMLQDYCLMWTLDVILTTLQDKFGWHSSMCNKFARLYDNSIPLLKDFDKEFNHILSELKENYNFILEIH